MLRRNEDCTYMYVNGFLYISLSFEDLTNIDECEDYFVVDVAAYVPEGDDDPIAELISKVVTV